MAHEFLLKIVSEAFLEFPNLHFSSPATMLVVQHSGDFDLDAAEDVYRLLELLRTCARSLEGIPVPSPNLPWHMLGEAIGFTALLIQHNSELSANGARVLRLSPENQIEIVFECRYSEVGRLAAKTAVKMWGRLLSEDPNQLHAIKDDCRAFRKRAKSLIPGLGTRLLFREARERGIPVVRMFDGMAAFPYSETIQLGQGIKQAQFLRGITSKTLQLGCELATQKSVASQLLGEQGIPIPPQRLAENKSQALRAAHEIGFPVVVKPNNQDNGVGVHTYINDETSLKLAIKDVAKYGLIQVEKHIEGFDHRITFVGNSLVGVLEILPANIRGDGRSTVRQLLETEPVATQGLIRGKIIVDGEVLEHIARAGLHLDDVLPQGREVILRRWWRNNNDHSLRDVTSNAHPENIAIAHSAARLLGLDVAGVDYLTTDISRSYRETGGAIVEVNSLPTLAGAQMCGLPAYRMLLDQHFPEASDGRIPSALFLSTPGQSVAIEVAAQLLSKWGHTVGVSTDDRLTIGDRTIGRNISNYKAGANLLLRNPQCSAALIQTTVSAIAAEGMPIDSCDVGIIPFSSEFWVGGK